MKRITAALILCALTTSALADSSACYTINDADARAYCQAKARKDTSTCYAIQDSAKRAVCMAEVRG